jgi:copper chaperone CopZ
MTAEIKMRGIRFVIWMLLVLPWWALAAPKAVVELDVQGMVCGACSYRVQKALSGLQGVEAVEVSLEQKKARVVLSPGTNPDLDQIRKVILDSGFTPENATVSTQGPR